MEDSIRWTIKVSKRTDISLRSYLAQHGMKKGDLSKFVEEAVRWRVLDKTVSEVRERNANVPEGEIEAAIDEALAAVRADILKCDCPGHVRSGLFNRCCPKAT